MSDVSIPFHIRGYDGEAAKSHPYDEGFADAVVDTSLGSFLLRNVFGATLFREAAAIDDDWTFFAFSPAPADGSLREVWLEEVLMDRQFGRFLQCRPMSISAYQEHETCFLLLKNAADSIAYFDGRRFEILREQIRIEGDICEMAPNAAHTLAEAIFNAAVNTQLDDPYITDGSFKEQPIEFICGSMEELRTITRWICHIEPKLFRTSSAIEISYNSLSKTDHNDDEQYRSGVNNTFLAQSYFTPRIKLLMDLAFECNNFTGVFWEHNGPSCDRLSGFSKYPRSIQFTLDAPSAHERAEALLSLAEWLKGKVPEAERQTLLGSD